MSLLVTAAEARGWTCVRPQRHGDARFVTSVHGRQVKIRVYRGPYGDESGWTLQVRVATPDPGLPAFRITREGFMSAIAGAFGGQDLLMGVPNFDYEYRVQSPEPDELRRVWTADRCQFLLDHVPGAVVRGTHEAVDLEVGRDSFEDSTLDRAVELAVELARSEVYGVAALRALPGARYQEGSDCGPHVELEGPSPIMIGPVRTSGRVVTRAMMQGFLPVPPPATARLGSATLAQDGDRVSVTWPGIEQVSQRLIAAIELLRTLRLTPHDSVYR